jgi:WD40 repeat protein
VDDADEEEHSTAVHVFSRLSIGDSEEEGEENNVVSGSSNHEAPDLVAESSQEEDLLSSSRPLQLLESIGDDDEDLFDLNPFKLGDENSPLLDEFTDDELIVALGHLNLGSENISDLEEIRDDPLLPLPPLSAGIETLSDIDDLLLPLADLEELSDIYFTDGAGEEAGDDLLLPIEDNIFDYDEGEGGPESPVTVVQHGAVSGDTQRELLDLLDSLSLAATNNNPDNSSNKEEIDISQEQETLVDDDLPPWFSLQPHCQPCECCDPSSLPEEETKSQEEEQATLGEDIPPWLYCQPCHQASDEAAPLAGDTSQQQLRPFHPFDPDFNDRDVDALLQLLQSTLDDPDMAPSPLLPPPPDEMPEPETKIELLNEVPQKDDEPQSSDPKEEEETSANDATPTSGSEQNIPQRSQRRAALRAAVPFLSTFDTALYSSESALTTNGDEIGGNNKKLSSKFLKSERSGLGHLERIMGLDFSECGRFLATAAADSTIRIWGVAKNNLLATLKAHDDKFECLRVAWASSMWGQDRLARSGGAKSAIAAIAAAAAAAGSGTTTTGTISGGNKKGEFNYLLATGGADGVVYLWGCADPNNDESAWTVYETLDHSTYSHFQVPQDANDKPQVYSVQFIDHWKALPSAMDDDANSFLMTSSDDHVHLWEVDNQKRAKSDEGSAQNKLHFREVFSLRFGSLHSYGYGVSVGQVTGKGLLYGMTATAATAAARNGAVAGIGTSTNDHVLGGTDRNPQGLIFVFDACYCPANGLLGVALSDGSLRLLHGRGVCLSILQLPGVKAHLTSFAWDSSGRHLATSVATGHVITWGIEWQEEQPHSSGCGMASSATTRVDGEGGAGGGTVLQTTCRSVLDGGHERGRPLFGVQYCGTDENLLLSWGVDGRLCL